MNFCKTKVQSTTTRGLFISSGSPVLAELAGGAGFDWLILDMEHGLGDEGDLLDMLRALPPDGAAPLVRVPHSGSDLIQRALDRGAAGIVCPQVSSAEEAESVVGAMRYPPRGRRGLSGGIRAGDFGRGFGDYFSRADQELLCVIQIENAAGLAAVSEIAAVDGVDVLFLGHSDLSLNLGCAGQMTAPAIVKAEEAVLAAAKSTGKCAGMLAKKGVNVAAYQARGFTFTALGTDLSCLRNSFSELLQ